MALDTEVDAPLAAMALLIRAAVADKIGADALTAVYADPRDLSTLAAGKLPAIAVYRHHREDDANVITLTILIDYVLPATSLEKRTTRWPVLDRVWTVIVKVLFAGHHPDVESDANVLDAASINVSGDIKVDYGFAEHGGKAYPFFRGLVVAKLPVMPDFEITDLDDYLEHYTAFDLPEGNNDENEADDTTILPAYGS